MTNEPDFDYLVKLEALTALHDYGYTDEDLAVYSQMIKVVRKNYLKKNPSSYALMPPDLVYMETMD